MNDGPHKSLHMPRRWKKVAEYGDNVSYEPGDVCDRLSVAILTELASVPFRKLNTAFAVDPSSLFEKDPASQIELVEAGRQHCRGSAIATTYIDGCVAALLEGKAGDDVIRAGIAAALDGCFRSSCRNMDEHYKRESSSKRAMHLMGRLNEAHAQCNFESEIGQILSTGQFKMRKPKSVPRTGTGDGPPLPKGQH